MCYRRNWENQRFRIYFRDFVPDRVKATIYFPINTSADFQVQERKMNDCSIITWMPNDRIPLRRAAVFYTFVGYKPKHIPDITIEELN